MSAQPAPRSQRLDEDCLVCGQPGAHFGRPGAAMHQSCSAVVHRIALEPMPGDEAFVALCDRLPRAHVLAGHLHYVTTAMLEDHLFGSA